MIFTLQQSNWIFYLIESIQLDTNFIFTPLILNFLLKQTNPGFSSCYSQSIANSYFQRICETLSEERKFIYFDLSALFGQIKDSITFSDNLESILEHLFLYPNKTFVKIALTIFEHLPIPFSILKSIFQKNHQC
jgi:hypothetical protein